MESCPLVISHILAERGRHTQLCIKFLCIITSLKWIIQICSNFYWWVSKIAFYPPNPAHIVVWGNFPFKRALDPAIRECGLRVCDVCARTQSFVPTPNENLGSAPGTCLFPRHLQNVSDCHVFCVAHRILTCCKTLNLHYKIITQLEAILKVLIINIDCGVDKPQQHPNEYFVIYFLRLDMLCAFYWMYARLHTDLVETKH